MGLDIRWPIGLMFTLIGALLAIDGAVVKSDHAISLGININLIWGIVLLVFGVFMLAGAVRGGKNSPSADLKPRMEEKMTDRLCFFPPLFSISILIIYESKRTCHPRRC